MQSWQIKNKNALWYHNCSVVACLISESRSKLKQPLSFSRSIIFQQFFNQFRKQKQTVSSRSIPLLPTTTAMSESQSAHKSSESLSLSGFTNPISTPKPLFFPSSTSPAQNSQLQSARSKFQLQHLHSLLPCSPLTLSLPQNLSSMVLSNHPLAQFNNLQNSQIPTSARNFTIPAAGTTAGYHPQLTSLQLIALKNSTHPYLPQGHSLLGNNIFQTATSKVDTTHNSNSTNSDPHSQPSQSTPLAIHSFEVVPSKLEMLKSKRRKLQASLTNDHIQQELNKIDSISQNDSQHTSRSVRLDSPSTISYGSNNSDYFLGFPNDSMSQMQKQHNSKDIRDNTSILREAASNPLGKQNEVLNNRSNKGVVFGLPLQLVFEGNGIQQVGQDGLKKTTHNKVEQQHFIDCFKKKADKQDRKLEINKTNASEHLYNINGNQIRIENELFQTQQITEQQLLHSHKTSQQKHQIKVTSNLYIANQPEESESVTKLKREMLQLIQENLRLKKAAYLSQQKYSSLQERYEITEMKYQAALKHTNTFHFNAASANTATTTSRQGIAPSCSFSSLIVQQEDRSSMVLPCIITRSNAVTPISSFNQQSISSFQQQSLALEDTAEDNYYSYKKQKFIQIHRLVDDNPAGGVVEKTEEGISAVNSKNVSSFSLDSNRIILHS